MVATETGCPPVLQQPGRKGMTLIACLKVSVVDQDFQRIRDATSRVVYSLGIQLFKTASCSRNKHVLSGCLGEDLHGHGKSLVVQPVLEPGFV